MGLPVHVPSKEFFLLDGIDKKLPISEGLRFFTFCGSKNCFLIDSQTNSSFLWCILTED